MKKRLIALLLMLVLLVPTVVASAAYYRVNTSSLKARMLPSANAVVLDSYRRDWALTLERRWDGGWAYVVFTNGKDAYVQTKYLAACRSYKAYITTDNTRMWKGPDSSFGEAGRLAKGLKVTVITHGSKYDYVFTRVGSGYVRNSFLSKKYVRPSGNESISTSTDPEPSEGLDGWIINPNNRTVNLRTGPGKNYAVIGEYKPGTKVKILDYGTTWSYIWVSGQRGYMMSQYITEIAPTPTETPRPAGGQSTLVGPPYTAYIYTGGNGYVNVHRGPGLGYANVCRAEERTQVTVLEWTSRTWYKIRVDRTGDEGYVKSEYLIRDWIW